MNKSFPNSAWVAMLAGNVLAWCATSFPEPLKTYLIALSGVCMGFGLCVVTNWIKERRSRSN